MGSNAVVDSITGGATSNQPLRIEHTVRTNQVQIFNQLWVILLGLLEVVADQVQGHFYWWVKTYAIPVMATRIITISTTSSRRPVRVRFRGVASIGRFFAPPEPGNLAPRSGGSGRWSCETSPLQVGGL